MQRHNICDGIFGGVLLGLMFGSAAAQGSSPTDRSAARLHVGGRLARTPAQLAASPYPDATPRYHNGESVICADCHISHASQSHPYGASPGPGEAVPFDGPGFGYLLKTADPVDLCLSCHDGHVFAPDVLGADANGLARRSAGMFDPPETPNPRGHDLGRNLPSGEDLCLRCHFGSATDRRVTCIDCHDPHGNGVARNLVWASDPSATPDLGLFVNPAASGMARYEATNVAYGSLNADALREPTSICIDCHHTLSGSHYIDRNGNGIHERHPSYDSERGSTNNIAQGQADGGSSPAHWASGTGSGFFTTPRLRFVVSGATDYAGGKVVDPNTNGVLCLTCHQAHGSDQAFGATWTLQNGYSAPGCDQCHNMANVPGPTAGGSPPPRPPRRGQQVSD